MGVFKKTIFKLSFVFMFILGLFLITACDNSSSNNESNNSNNNSENTEDETKKYTITWKNYDGSVLETDTNVEEGTMPTYDGVAPSKPATDEFTYTFAGWDKTVSRVTEDETYTAVFTSETNAYTIIWKNYDGEVLETDTEVLYGTTPTYDGEIPTRETDTLIYEFNGWDKAISSVTGDAEYVAVCNEKARLSIKYTIYNADDELVDTYTEKPDFLDCSESGIYAKDTEVALTSNEPTGYNFEGWYDSLGNLIDSSASYNFTISQSTTIEARYSKKLYNLNVYISNTSCGNIAINGVSYTEHENTTTASVGDTITLEAISTSTIEFLGWYDENNNQLSADETYNYVMGVTAAKVYAKWNYFTIKYINERVTINSTNPDHYQAGDTIVLSDPVVYHCQFNGWKLNGEYITQIDTSLLTDLSIECDLTFDSNLDNLVFDPNESSLTILGLVNTSVSNVHIPADTYRIVSKIFEDTTSLEAVYYDGTISQWAQIYFDTASSNPMFMATRFYILDENGTEEYNNKTYSNLESIILDETISGINAYAFYNFDCVRSLLLPNTIGVIGSSAFEGLDNLSKIYYDGTSQEWTKINFVDFTSSPLNSAYKDYTADLYLLDEEGDLEFNDKKYSLITDLIYDESIVDVNVGSNYCLPITNLVLPSSIIRFSKDCFRDCSYLSNVYYNGTISQWCQIIFDESGGYVSNPMYYASNFYILDEEGNVEFNGNKYTRITDVILDDSVSKISSYSFAYFAQVENLVLPETISTINKLPFDGCDNLTNVYYNGTISDWVNISFYDEKSNPMYYASNFYILDNSGTVEFNGNKYSKLDTVILDENLSQLNPYLFYNIKDIKNVEIPKTITAIYEAFTNCTGIENVYFDGTISDWAKIGFFATTSNPMYYASNFYILDNSGTVEFNENKYTKLTEVILDNTVSIINENAFKNMMQLTKIVVPNSVTLINSGTFYGCGSIKSITLPFVGEYDGWNPLGHIFGCESFTGAVKTCQKFYSKDASQSSEENYYIPSSLTEVIITDATTIISGAFYNCSNLKRITIPNTVETMGIDTFYGCSSLEYLSIPFVGTHRYTKYENRQYNLGYLFSSKPIDGWIKMYHLTYINSSNTHLMYYYYLPATLNEIAITDCEYLQVGALSGLYDYADFSNTSFGAITITLCSTITEIGDYAFMDSAFLVAIKYLGTVKQWNSITKGTGYVYTSGTLRYITCTDGKVSI